MANPLFNMFGNNSNGGPFTNVTQLMNQFEQFKSTFQGDPQQKVQELMNSGQMSQEQFAQLSSMAQTFQQLMHK